MKLLLRMAERGFRRWALPTAALLAFAPATASAANASAPTEWTIRYSFGTFLYGGTLFDVDAGGRFHIRAGSKDTGSLPNRRIDLDGTLPKDELSALAALVEAARPGLWSAQYTKSGCLDYGVELTLVTRGSGRDDGTTTKTSWGCRLAGVPGDLRALLAAIRADIRARVPIALTDVEYGEAPPGVSPSGRIVLEDSNIASRRVVIDADGKIVSRERISKTLYPLAPCPVRDLGSASASDLERMRAMLVPLGESINYVTSVETQRLFDAAMSDCARPSAWLDSAYLVPPNARWALQFSMVRPSGRSSVQLDSRGHAQVSLGVSDSVVFPVTLDATTVQALNHLVAGVEGAAWKSDYLGSGSDCVDFVRIARFDGAGRISAETRVACGASALPNDLLALDRFLHDKFASYVSDSALLRSS